jgi:hypothetical protein
MIKKHKKNVFQTVDNKRTTCYRIEEIETALQKGLSFSFSNIDVFMNIIENLKCKKI